LNALIQSRQEDKSMDLKGQDHSSVEWAKDEFENANLGDARLKTRLIKLAARLSESPQSPIHQACEDWAETKAAYRFFKNDQVSGADIFASHTQKTAKRAQGEHLILAIQDTSYLLYTDHKKTIGLGVISGKKTYQVKDFQSQGLVMHTSFAVTTDGLPLGVLDQNIFARKPTRKVSRADKNKTYIQRKPQLQTVKIESKESYQWIASLQKTTQAMAQVSDCRVVTVGDREADIFEVFLAAHHTHSSALIRARSDRVVNRVSARKHERLWTHIQSEPCQGKIQLEIPSRNRHPARSALLELRFGRVKVSPSRSLLKGQAPDLHLSAIHVIERHPPKGEEPLEWMLLTDLIVTNFDEAAEKVKWYSLRWRVEVFHKILKSGLRVEDCRLESADRLIRYLSVMSIIAWRIYWIDLVGRTDPKLPCTAVLTQDEWKILYCKAHKTHHPSKKIPTIYEVIHWIARLGGFLDRKGDGEPGVVSIWRGWKRLTDLSEGWSLAMTAKICG
jgi:hypothetical protein